MPQDLEMSEPVEITKEVVREVVLSGSQETRERFLKEYGDEVERFVEAFHGAYQRFKEVETRVENDQRSAWSQMFLYADLNSLVTSTHLLISGFISPSGNLMRQFGESVAMALLLSHRGINTYEVFSKAPKEFSVNKAVGYASKAENAKLLNLNKKGWASFREITAFYDKYSHASALTAASMVMLGTKGGLAFGSEFDEEKKPAYKVELSRRISACASLIGVIEQVEDQLLHSEE